MKSTPTGAVAVVVVSARAGGGGVGGVGDRSVVGGWWM